MKIKHRLFLAIKTPHSDNKRNDAIPWASSANAYLEYTLDPFSVYKDGWNFYRVRNLRHIHLLFRRLMRKGILINGWAVLRWVKKPIQGLYELTIVDSWA